MGNKKPELYYDEKGHPKGYRVGVSDEVYGICPFCGKAYTEEDIKDPEIINFEHIFSRFGAKRALNEKKVFSKIESEFMVAVHKSCNDKGCIELEKQISRIIDNFNKYGVQLTKLDAEFLINYCIKISVFLRYLFLWNETENTLCYDNKETAEFYKHFDVRIRHVNSSAGIYWGLSKVANVGKYCFTIIINDIEISYFYDTFGYKYEDDNAIFIKPFPNNILLLLGNEYGTRILMKKHTLRKSIPWKLEKTRELRKIYENNIESLSSSYDDMFGLPKNYFIRQKKLSKMTTEQLDRKIRETEKGKSAEDKEIVFYHNGQFYFINNDGVLQNLSDLPNNTEIPSICFRKYNITQLPRLSHLKITGDFVILDSNLTTLKGSPRYVDGAVSVRNNKLSTLKQGPKYVGKGYYCDYNELVNLEGAPEKVKESFICYYNKLTSLKGSPGKIGGVFDCCNNKLTSLADAPKEVGGMFLCYDNELKSFDCKNTKINGSLYFDAKHLESLNGLPKAKRYIIIDCDEEFDTADQLRTWFTKYKESRNGAKFYSAQKKIKMLQKAIIKATDGIKPNDSHEM